MAKAGKKPKPGPRYPCGKLRGETEMQITAAARAYREKFLPMNIAMREEAECELGRLYLRGALDPVAPYDRDKYSGKQLHRAGFEYMRLVHDSRCLQGIPSPFPRAMDFGAVHGLSLHSEPDVDRVRRVANMEMRARTVLADAGPAVSREVYSVCIEDKPVGIVDNLKTGLLALAGLFEIPVDTQAR